jgi:hypothetical protein
VLKLLRDRWKHRDPIPEAIGEKMNRWLWEMKVNGATISLLSGRGGRPDRLILSGRFGRVIDQIAAEPECQTKKLLGLIEMSRIYDSSIRRRTIRGWRSYNHGFKSVTFSRVGRDS